jgi:hypothetical protein
MTARLRTSAEDFRHMAANFRAEGHYLEAHGQSEAAGYFWDAAKSADSTAERIEKEKCND